LSCDGSEKGEKGGGEDESLHFLRNYGVPWEGGDYKVNVEMEQKEL